MEETLDVTILLSSLKNVIETNDKVNSNILKNTLTKIAFKNDKISFDQLNEIKRDLEDIFKTAESFVASLRLINEEEKEGEEIILEAPEEFRNGNEPKRSETYREEGNNNQRQPEVTLLYTQEEVSCENQIQNAFTNDNITQKESKDKGENISNETYQIDKNNDKITNAVRDGCVVSVDKVGVVAKPDCYYRLNELLLRPSPIHQYVLSGSRSANIVSIETNEDETGVANTTRSNSEFNCCEKVCESLYEEVVSKDIEMSRISSEQGVMKEEKKFIKCTDVELPPPLNLLVQQSFLNQFSSEHMEVGNEEPILKEIKIDEVDESKLEDEITEFKCTGVALPPPLDLSFLTPIFSKCKMGGDEEKVLKNIDIDGINTEDDVKENERKFKESECTGVELPPPLDLFIQDSFFNPVSSERSKSLLDLINLKIDECNVGAILENDLNQLANDVEELNVETIQVDKNKKTEDKQMLVNDVLNDESSNFNDLNNKSCCSSIEETSNESNLLESLEVLSEDKYKKHVEISENNNESISVKRCFDIEGNEIYYNVQEEYLNIQESVLNKDLEITEKNKVDSLNQQLSTDCDENLKDKNIPIKINAETSPRIFDLPIIGNHNYSNSIISKIALEQSQNKLDELLKLPKNNRKDKKSNLNNNVTSESLNLNKIEENRTEYLNEEKVVDTKDIVNLEKINKSPICINLDDTITKLNLEMQRSAEIDESLQLKEEGDACDTQRSIDAAASTCVRCAHADQCSCLPATEEDRAPRQHNNILHRDHNLRETNPEENINNLSWSFQNGRLVFEDVIIDEEEISGPSILTSKNVNPKNNNENGRIKILEEKLKEAGITDGKNDLDCLLKEEDKDEDIGNSVVVTSSSSDEEEDFFPSDSEDVPLCEFNSQKPFVFFYNENDELEDEDYEEIFIMRGDNAHQNAEQQQQRKLHNPDKENLKSLLKKPGGKNVKEHQQQQLATKKNRVVFNETKNEFFDADYIILIREECEYDEEEDDGVCTCNQHEMVRLTCCEPNCNCNVYGDGYDTTPPSPKFAPPLEFVDAVTLSPPEEYKDMELEEQQLIALQQITLRGQRGAVCRECSASHDEDGESLSDNDEIVETPSDEQIRDVEGKEKTDQSQQTTPTTPPAEELNDEEGQRYILETVTMTTVSERQIMKEAEEKPQSPSPAPSITPTVPPGGSPISGILKGGRLWKQTSNENNTINNLSKNQDLHQSENITSDDEGTNKRSVRFIESKENQTPKQRDVCDGAPDVTVQEEIAHQKPDESKESSVINQSPNESTEMMLTFKLGNHVLISNNSLKPNSAVRQLFPCTKPPGKVEETVNNQQYLVTAESLKAFEEAKRSKLPQIIQSGDTDESIRRAIERNTLRRSLIRGDPKNKKSTQKTDNSLVERIKQLTCDVDDSEIVTNVDELQQQQRASPPGEEARNSPEVNANKHMGHVDKSFSPSSSSTASSNSSMSSTYKKITDLFSKSKPDIQNVDGKLHLTAPDLGNGTRNDDFIQETNSLKINPTTESRKQFLSTLVPLTACVSGIGLNEDYYHINNGPEVVGDRTSMASSVGTEYSLEDIDEVLRKDEEESCKKIAPDVIAGTPSASESGDELAMFVQQDAGRIERIKKKYQPEATEEDDEHDDYGFNRRPSVRGIKPRFGSTTEILQQIQNQMQPPNNTPPRNQNQQANQVVWPYYSETNVDVKRNPQVNYPIYPNQINNEDKRTAYVQYSTPSRPSSYIEENLYQNCTNQRCTQINYRNMNVVYPSSVVRIGRNSRPLSPPPQEVSKNYHQTMVYIPYNHIEGYHHNYYNTPKECYARVSNQNQINKRYIEAYRVEDHYSKPIIRQQQVVYQQRSESPQFHQSTARSTQTPSLVTSSNCYSVYPQRYATRTLPPNGMVYQDGGVYPKINRHSYPRYPPSSDSLSLTDSDSQHSKCSMPNSPTKANSNRFIERGVPEGAASVSPQDCGQMNNSSTMTSPTSPQNPQKPMFYAMNV